MADKLSIFIVAGSLIGAAGMVASDIRTQPFKNCIVESTGEEPSIDISNVVEVIYKNPTPDGAGDITTTYFDCHPSANCSPTIKHERTETRVVGMVDAVVITGPVTVESNVRSLAQFSPKERSTLKSIQRCEAQYSILTNS